MYHEVSQCWQEILLFKLSTVPLYYMVSSNSNNDLTDHLRHMQGLYTCTVLVTNLRMYAYMYVIKLKSQHNKSSYICIYIQQFVN